MNHNIVYPVKFDENTSNSDVGYRANYFYLHGVLEELNDYDICNMNGELISKLLRPGIKFATCKINNIEHNCLVISSYESYQIEGYVVKINDFDAIKDAMNKFKPNEFNDVTMSYLKTNFKDTYDYVRNLFNINS